MAIGRGRSSAWGIATGGEASYDAGDTITHLLYPFGSAGSAQSAEGFDMGQLATGYEESLETVITRYTTGVPFNGIADDKSLPILAGFALGGGDTKSTPAGATTARQHILLPTAIAVELPSTAIQCSLSASSSTTANDAMVHRGCVCDTFSFGGDVNSNNGVYTIQANFRASGTTATGADLSAKTRPSKIFSFNETYHAVSSTLISALPIVKLPTDASPTPTYIEIGADGSNFSPFLQGWRWTVNNDLDVNGGHNTASTLVANNMYRNQRTQSLTSTYRWATANAAVGTGSTTEILNLRANVGNTFSVMFSGVTRTVISAADATDYRYAFTVFFPKVTLTNVSFQPSPGIMQMTCDWSVNEPNVTNLYSAHLYVWNGEDVDYL
jgi:hypothetical protein